MRIDESGHRPSDRRRREARPRRGSPSVRAFERRADRCSLSRQSAQPARSGTRLRRRRAMREGFAGLALVAPALAVFGVFVFYPPGPRRMARLLSDSALPEPPLAVRGPVPIRVGAHLFAFPEQPVANCRLRPSHGSGRDRPRHGARHVGQPAHRRHPRVQDHLFIHCRNVDSGRICDLLHSSEPDCRASQLLAGSARRQRVARESHLGATGDRGRLDLAEHRLHLHLDERSPRIDPGRPDGRSERRRCF